MDATTDRGLEITCQACGATIVVAAHLRTADCPYCASPHVVERPPAADRPRPTFALGFAVDAERARGIARDWVKSRGFFAHGGLKRAVMEKTRGVYLPAYLYSAVAAARYTAEIGEQYTETRVNAKDKSVETVTRTEWRDLAGAWEAYVRDVIVTASGGLANDRLAAIEPFDLRALRRFRPAVISGWPAEEPSRDRDGCLRTARGETVEQVRRELEDFLPGDEHRRLECQVEVRDEAAELVLLPVWVFAVRYAPEEPPVRLLINGQTGVSSGRVPLSVPRIVLAALFGVASIVAALLLWSVLR